MGNCITEIVELIPLAHWSHVEGFENPADCASRGILPSELVEHQLWWNGPCCLQKDTSEWPKGSIPAMDDTNEEKLFCHLTTHIVIQTILVTSEALISNSLGISFSG